MTQNIHTQVNSNIPTISIQNKKGDPLGRFPIRTFHFITSQGDSCYKLLRRPSCLLSVVACRRRVPGDILGSGEISQCHFRSVLPGLLNVLQVIPEPPLDFVAVDSHSAGPCRATTCEYMSANTNALVEAVKQNNRKWFEEIAI
jgi:hypothetical protein